MHTFTSALVTFLMLLTISCSYRQSIRVGCHLDSSGQACDNLFGKDDRDVEAKNKRALESLQSQIDELVAANEILQESLAGLGVTLTTLQTIIAGSVTMEQYDALQVQINSLNASIDNLQEQSNVNTVRLVELESQDTVVQYYDPCGDGPGYDEILMTTKSGKLVAYFESGSKRFLTILGPGSYITTDQSACFFTIDSSGQITNEHL